MNSVCSDIFSENYWEDFSDEVFQRKYSEEVSQRECTTWSRFFRCFKF